MDKRQEVKKTPKDYLEPEELQAYNDRRSKKKDGSAKQKIGHTMYNQLSEYLANGRSHEIAEYLAKKRASSDYKIAFGLTGRRDTIDLTLDLNKSSSSWSS